MDHEYWIGYYLTLVLKFIPLIVASLFGGLVRAMYSQCHSSIFVYFRDCITGLFIGITIFAIAPDQWNQNLRIALAGISAVFSKDVLNFMRLILPNVLTRILRINVGHSDTYRNTGGGDKTDPK